MIAKLAHRVRKVRVIGLPQAVRAWYNKKKIQKTAIAWQQNPVVTSGISRLLDDAEFNQLFASMKGRSFSFMHTLYLNEPSTTIIKEANQYVRCTVDILGSGLREYARMPWAVDVRLQQQNPTGDIFFDSDIYFADVVIQQSPTDALTKDIRVPWELSRFTYLPIPARAYLLTGDKVYIDIIIAHWSDWLEQNPFLYGPNWVNAMEVAIRAMNWIATFDLIKHVLPESCVKQLITALYQHMIYIEHNWEYYDSRTNNHYLTNLVGYLYVTHFFADIPSTQKKFDWCVAELMRELDKQILADGTSYEGSTQYHKLVTEVYYLAYVLLQDKHLIVSLATVTTLQRMISFLVWCTPHQGNLVTIGDHDSGIIMRGGLAYTKLAAIWSSEAQPTGPYRVFEAFGLSIIKTESWHVTLRHHAYHPRQPSGHFHNDVGSITLAVDGIPIFVDPGSFVYTASVLWRNYFRSTEVHNSCFIKGIEPVELDDNLFDLQIPNGMSNTTAYTQDDIVHLCMHHSLYKKYGLTVRRDIAYDMSLQRLTITDRWLSKIKQLPHLSAWNFTLAPDIVPIQECKDRWLLVHDGKPLLYLQSHDLDFVVGAAWVSPEYGVKIETHALYAQANVAIDKPFIIIVYRA
jgi:hypothetical protein